MKNLEDLFKQICAQEAKNLNDFYEKSNIRLTELEIEIKDEKIKERTRQLRYTKLCEDIDQILTYDGYIGDYSDVIEYFDRTHLQFSSVNCYFNIQPKLKGLYNLLQKSMKTDKLEKLMLEKENIENNMNKFSYITEEILYNSILKAFQEIVPKQSTNYFDVFPPRFYESQETFPWTREVNKIYVSYDLVEWYINAIDEYLRTPVKDLKLSKMQTFFK